ncbi:hypothetical protein PENTCL1PPCAC_8827, partial [Pristionchus entomophagus]
MSALEENRIQNEINDLVSVNALQEAELRKLRQELDELTNQETSLQQEISEMSNHQLSECDCMPHDLSNHLTIFSSKFCKDFTIDEVLRDEESMSLYKTECRLNGGKYGVRRVAVAKRDIIKKVL